jgi:MYXO-CTERM domain-containing protein
MKKFLGSLAAVALFAAPAMAELAYQSITIPKGSYTIEIAPDVEVPDGTRHSAANLAGNYNNLQLGHAQTQYRIPNNAGAFVGDDLHMNGNSVTGYRWVYSDPGVGSHTSTVAFFNNTPADGGPLLGNTVTFTSGGTTFGAVFNITGLPNATATNPGGGWLITVTLPTLLAAGNDLWVGFQSNSPTVGTPANLGLRGTNLQPNVPAANEGVGSSHNLHFSGLTTSSPGTSFFSHTGGGNFRQAALPEPAVAGLLALGGLVVLRRRK